MEINKFNVNCVDMNELSLHDSFISMLTYNPSQKRLTIEFKDVNRLFLFSVENVFDYSFTSKSSYNGMFPNQINDWEEIPESDNYLLDVKSTFIANGGMWNDDLFAIRIVYCDLHEIRIICQKVIISTSGEC